MTTTHAKSAKKSTWNRSGLTEWTEDDQHAFISAVFSWNLQDAYQRATWYKSQGYHVTVGGPAIHLQPQGFHHVADVTAHYHDAIARHNPNATFTTRGCIRRCPYCIVPKIEPFFEELADWPARPIVCDNNLLAASKAHFQTVIDRLKPLSNIDIQQGLDARLLTKWHAELLAQLDHTCIRLAWDKTRTERHFMRAFQILRHAGFQAKNIRVYCLIGYTDTPDDALYRLHKTRAIGATPFPMRYQPLNAPKRNAHIPKHWTHAELTRYMRYWSNLHRTGSIPFEEFEAQHATRPEE